MRCYKCNVTVGDMFVEVGGWIESDELKGQIKLLQSNIM